MQHFRKLPVVIEAVQWTGTNVLQVYSFMHGAPTIKHDIARDRWDDFVRIHEGKEWLIKTLEDGQNDEAKHVASVADWIIKGIHGEFYPCKPEIFDASYEKVSKAEIEIMGERTRQQEVEKFLPEDDDKYRDGELTKAAVCYVLHGQGGLKPPFGDGEGSLVSALWPWSKVWWKPSSRKRDLIKAAALIKAEIERIDRAEAAKP